MVDEKDLEKEVENSKIGTFICLRTNKEYTAAYRNTDTKRHGGIEIDECPCCGEKAYIPPRAEE